MTDEPGPLHSIVDLFARGWRHLKLPRLNLDVPEVEGLSISINVAGERAVDPGSLVVFEGGWDSSEGHRWFLGRISAFGHWSPARDEDADMVEQRLVELSRDPVRVVGDFGRRTGRCPFCRRRLRQEAEATAGYDEVCAGAYGLPWSGPVTIGAGMSGMQLQDLRTEMGMDYVSFGEQVLGHKGKYQSIRRAVMRLEEKPVLDQGTVDKAMAGYHRWMGACVGGHDEEDEEDEYECAYRSLRGSR